MGYEDVFRHLGSYGRYQRRVHLLLCLPSVLVAFHRLAGVFLLAVPQHRCRLPSEPDNATYESLNVSLPWSACRLLDAEQGQAANGSRACGAWLYDRSVYADSVVTEHDLVCEAQWLVPTGQAVFMLGDLLGSLLFGALSDRFGRKSTFFLALVLQVGFGLALAFLTNIVAFLALRVAIGMATAGVFNSSYVIGIELVGPDMRLFAGVAVELFWCVGYLALTGLAYLFRNWQSLQIAISVPGLLFLCYWWLIPESARWLMAEGRTEEARALLQHAAHVNRVTLPEEVITDALRADQAQQQKEVGLLALLRHRKLCLRCLNIFFNWFAVCSVFYGLSLNTSNLGGNDYLNFFLTGLVEIPAYCLLLLTLNRWGRVPILGSSLLLGGAAMLAIAAVPTDMNWLVVTIAMIGKFSVSCAFATEFIYTLEAFPTVIRNAAVGAGATCARFGSLISPYINLLNIYWGPLPSLIFGAFLLIAGLTAFLLPETLNKDLPDSLEEGEKFGDGRRASVLQKRHG